MSYVSRISILLLIPVVVLSCSQNPSACSTGDAGLDCTGNWCRPTLAVKDPIYRIWGMNSEDLWFVGGGGTILRYKSPDAGNAITWTQVDAGANFDLYAIWGNNSDDVWVTGATALWTATSNSVSNVMHYVRGATPEWTRYKQFRYVQNNMIWGFADAGDLHFASCANYSSAVWTLPADGGPAISETLPQEIHLYGSWAASTTDQWVVGRQAVYSAQTAGRVPGPRGASSAPGKMFRKQADGAWKNADSTGLKLFTPELETAVNGGAWFSDIRGTSATDVWAVGTKGLVAHFDGNQWRLVDAGAGSANLYGVWPVSPTEVWVSGGVWGDVAGATPDQPKFMRYENASGQAKWQDIAAPSDAGILYRVWTSGAACGVWLSGTKGILRYTP